MALTLVNSGEQAILERAFNKSATGDLVLRLYQTATISETLVCGALPHLTTVVEATFTGYVPATLTGASWNITAGAADYAEQTFTSSAGAQNQDINGYYLTDVAGSTLYWIEGFTGAPYTIVNNGDNIKVTPTINLD